MIALFITLSTIAFLLVATFAISLVCFLKVFYSPTRKKTDEISIPNGEIYEEHRDIMVKWTLEMRAMPHRNVSVRSFDGLTLRGKYYEYAKGAPIEILFHGYRGNSERDLCGGIARCFLLGHNALIVDHRGGGESDGHVITFGIYESRDCHKWVDLVLSEIDPDAKIILGGVSMGGATVMLCSSHEFPENVVGAVADCGYTSTKAIVKKVMREMKLPADLLYPFVRLGARLFGNFDPDLTSPIESMKKCRLPIVFFHGDKDDFVPYEMSVENYNACVAPKKKFVTVEGAGHGLAFVVDQQGYIDHLREFFDPIIENKA